MSAQPEKRLEDFAPLDQDAGEEIDFAKSLKKLEEIVKALESGELSLEESLKKFEEGIRLARQLEGILDRAERRIQEILGTEETASSDR
ncbi:MAG TPA: exodeoxyribonuclease VII small subunit [Firmicutes bacterium]|uniref:Exodeoxyribonuclease 7 small subunit n=1 Tax=Candidatus Fermentithermobacillus carboniphilus TaxID=3085328 RepID=A0AAT9LDG8_9FIRM|nr:MAG: exodeoxyribonuclease VII small subunit [Candidatus Fermentithermobacillus carboniphilus]HHW17928.1 exodeoxyribonuclease VII small subunit [Candidatus Fermentithermobacillaceae bacterium]